MRDPIPTWTFALAVVQKGDRFLLVHERKHGQTWYLPAGRVEPGERISDAAVREAREESGVPIVLDGVMRVQHTVRSDGARLRVLYHARPADDTPPRTTPDEESLGAGWFTLEEMARLPLRGDEVEALCALAIDGKVYPLAVLGEE